MRVAQMQDSVAVERRRKIGEGQGEFAQLGCQRIAAAAAVKAEAARDRGKGMDAAFQDLVRPMRVALLRADMAALPFHEAAAVRPDLARRAERQLGDGIGRCLAGKLPYGYDDI